MIDEDDGCYPSTTILPFSRSHFMCGWADGPSGVYVVAKYRRGDTAWKPLMAGFGNTYSEAREDAAANLEAVFFNCDIDDDLGCRTVYDDDIDVIQDGSVEASEWREVGCSHP